ncbi:MAG: PEP-CTERM sorting domain-containing protein [Thiobacillus sp.]|nr:PEP-CTERM sorting domain-containing protein [Thiobacillus sp.]
MQFALPAALVLGALAAPGAQAASYCGSSLSNGEGLSKDDMSFNAASATDCYGVASGNDNASDINALANWQDPAGNWALLAKSDDGSVGSGILSGINFTLSATAGTVGTWTLSAVDTNGPAYADLPVTMDFVGVLKASNGFAAYYFDDALVSSSNAGTWTIAFTNRGSQFPDLSHLSLYTRVDATGNIPPIPEAETYAMMLVGLGLVGFMVRRRTRLLA